MSDASLFELPEVVRRVQIEQHAVGRDRHFNDRYRLVPHQPVESPACRNLSDAFCQRPAKQRRMTTLTVVRWNQNVSIALRHGCEQLTNDVAVKYRMIGRNEQPRRVVAR